jgi:uncharacterized protein YkwD
MKLLFHCAFIFLLTAAHAAQGALSNSSAEKRIFEELNTERISQGLNALQWDDHAAAAARAHAQLLAENGKLSHQFPGESSLPERLGATGVRFTVSAENVARTEFVEDAHPALMGSSGHRANILNTGYNAVGIGVVEEKGKIYVTQDFISWCRHTLNCSLNPRLLKHSTLPGKAKASGRLSPAKMQRSMSWRALPMAMP